MRDLLVKAMICLLLLTFYPLASAIGTQDLNAGLPKGTKITQLGDEVYLNGIPALMIGVAIPSSIKEAAKFLGDQWSSQGWTVNLERNGEMVLVMAIDGEYQKVASLNKTGLNTTEGVISLMDLPRRLATGNEDQLPIAAHLLKPVNTTVLNEIRVRDALGEAITTTLTNDFDVEQNSAFYQERMVEDGWKMVRKKTVIEGGGVILVFVKPKKEATFTFVRVKRQSFTTVNWINK